MGMKSCELRCGRFRLGYFLCRQAMASLGVCNETVQYSVCSLRMRAGTDAGDLASTMASSSPRSEQNGSPRISCQGSGYLSRARRPGDRSHPLMWETVSVWRAFRSSSLPGCWAAATLAHAGAEPPFKHGLQNLSICLTRACCTIIRMSMMADS